jgi:putative ABC transport system permease protein
VIDDQGSPQEILTITGVAADVERDEFIKRHWPVVYRPFKQARIYHAAVRIGMRIAPGAAQPLTTVQMAQAAVREAIQRPAQAFKSTEQSLSVRLRPNKINAMALNLFAGFAIMLAAMGVYSTVAYAGLQQRREIGIRMALGAERHTILWLVARRSLLTVVIGASLGIAGSFAAQRGLTSMMHEIRPANPEILALSILLLMMVAIAAVVVPARRATLVDPLVTLRDA